MLSSNSGASVRGRARLVPRVARPTVPGGYYRQRSRHQAAFAVRLFRAFGPWLNGTMGTQQIDGSGLSRAPDFAQLIVGWAHRLSSSTWALMTIFNSVGEAPVPFLISPVMSEVGSPHAEGLMPFCKHESVRLHIDAENRAI